VPFPAEREEVSFPTERPKAARGREPIVPPSWTPFPRLALRASPGVTRWVREGSCHSQAIARGCHSRPSGRRPRGEGNPSFTHRFLDPLPEARVASLAGGDTVGEGGLVPFSGDREEVSFPTERPKAAKGKGTHNPAVLDPLPEARVASLAGGDTVDVGRLVPFPAEREGCHSRPSGRRPRGEGNPSFTHRFLDPLPEARVASPAGGDTVGEGGLASSGSAPRSGT